MMIPGRKFHGMMATISIVSLFTLLYACWSDTNLPIQSAPALWQIMGAVLVVCGLHLCIEILSASRKIFRRFNVEKEGLATLLAAVPFQCVYYAKRNEPRSLKNMY